MGDIGKTIRFVRNNLILFGILAAWMMLAWLCQSWPRGLGALLTIGLGLYGMRFVSWRKARLAMLAKADLEAPKLRELVWAFLLETRRILHVRGQWRKVCRSLGLTSPTLKVVPKLRHVKGTLNGDVTAGVFPGAVHADVEAFQKNAPKMAGMIRGGCKEVNIRTTSPGNAQVTFVFSEPLKRTFGLDELPVSPDSKMLVLGVGSDGKPILARKDLAMMIGGMPGVGKSTLLHMLVAQLLADGEHVWLYISDAKGGAELSEYGDEEKIGVAQGRLTVQAYAKNSAQTKVMLEKAAKDLAIRQAWLGRSKTRKLVKPSEANPRAVVILDEQVLIQDVYRKGTDTDLGMIYASGRNALFTVWGCTQDGRSETIPSSLRTLIPTRVCFATDTPDSTGCVLGKGAEERKGARCSDLDPQKDQGVFFTGSEDARWMTPGRAPMVRDDEVRLIAQGVVPPAMRERKAKGAPPRPYVLYRAYDDSVRWAREYGARPVYIGITNDWARRQSEHKREDWKWCDLHGRMENYWAVHVTRADTTQLTLDVRDALREERLAVRTEFPVFNVMHNRGGVLGRHVQSWFRRAAVAPVEPAGVVSGPVLEPVSVWPLQPRTQAVNGHVREDWSE